MVRLLIRHALSDLKSKLASNLLCWAIIVTGAAFAITYGIFMPEAQEMYFRDAQTCRWDIEASQYFTPDMEQEATRIITEAGGKATAVLRTNAALLGKDGKTIAGIGALCLLPNDVVFPVDLFSAPQYVLEGDPYAEGGAIVEAATASRYGIHAGDTITVRMGASNWEGTESSVDTYEIAVAAIVAPSYNLSGMACFIPQGLAQATLAMNGLAATQVYCIADDESALDTIYANLRELLYPDVPEERGVTIYFGADQIRSSMDQYERARGKSSGFKIYHAMATIVVALCLLEGLIKAHRRTRDYASFVAIGADSRSIARFVTCETLVEQAILGALGIILALKFEESVYSWVPPHLNLWAFSIAMIVFLATGLVQALIITRALAPKKLLAALSVEGE